MSGDAPVSQSSGTIGTTVPPRRELLTVEVASTSGGVQATVRGELDESTAPKLIERIEGSVEPGQDLAVDLGGLTFCGSAGLSALILIERSVAGGGGSLTIARATPFVVQLLEMAGLDGLITAPPAA